MAGHRHRSPRHRGRVRPAVERAGFEPVLRDRRHRGGRGVGGQRARRPAYGGRRRHLPPVGGRLVGPRAPYRRRPRDRRGGAPLDRQLGGWRLHPRGDGLDEGPHRRHRPETERHEQPELHRRQRHPPRPRGAHVAAQHLGGGRRPRRLSSAAGVPLRPEGAGAAPDLRSLPHGHRPGLASSGSSAAGPASFCSTMAAPPSRAATIA